MRNVLAHAGKQGRRVISAFIATAFAQNDAKAASQQWRHVADQIRPKVPKLATLLDEAETDVLAYMSFPLAHRAKLHSTDEIDKASSSVTWLFSFWRNHQLVSNPARPIGAGARLYRSCALADLRGGFAGGFLGPLGIQFLTI
jgi:hypothetical protein